LTTILPHSYVVDSNNSHVSVKGKKVKKVDLYSAFIVVPHAQGARVRITQCYLQITPCLPYTCIAP